MSINTGLQGGFDSEENEQIENFQQVIQKKREIMKELHECKSQRAMLERENEYLMATLHDIREGLDALHWHIKVANGSPLFPEPNQQFIQMWQTIRATQTELRNIIDEWESKWILPEGELPF